MDRLKLLETLVKDLQDGNAGSVKFFRNDIYHVFIWFQVLIFFYSEKKLNVELLFKDNFMSNISRPTIFKIIDNAVAKKYLRKDIDDIDHRKINIYPTEITIDEFKKWSLIYKGY